MVNQTKNIRLTVIVLVAIVALVAGLFVSQHFMKAKGFDASRFHGTLLNQPREINPFSLKGTDGKSFNNASLNGQWTMVFFGFTNCGYLCPTTMAELGKFYKLLESKGVQTLPQVVMISIDPERDKMGTLKTYVTAFDPHFYGAKGSKGAVKAMTKELGIAYAKIALNGQKDSEIYDIEHTGTVLLFNPNGQLNAFFTSPQNAQNLAEDFMLLTS